MEFLAQSSELLRKKLESAKVDAANAKHKLSALESRDEPLSTLLALRSVLRLYRENIASLRKAIRNSQSSAKRLALGAARKA
jgi:hypothetical protein